ncbi:MAG: (2Fe-2S)-binding protein [Tannerellaceae bacterium]|jgi:nitrite reductase/ring-hydroxylating ferredoxin subunit|nr:(2Fe-2S)-binding protein [Tannerellaceae bacterium]
MKYTRILACLLFITISSCDKKYVSNIPNFPVYLELDLRFEDRDLLSVQAYKVFTSKNINQAIEKTGYGGVLVYHGLSTAATSYYAFDISCPHEANRSVVVEVDDAGIYAVCPKCGSKYELLNGIGNPVSGPSQQEGYYLKSYTVTANGDKIIIRN